MDRLYKLNVLKQHLKFQHNITW